MTRLLFICGSPRKAATSFALNAAKSGAESIGNVQVEMFYLHGKNIAPCVGCNACVKKGVHNCTIYQDDMANWCESFWSYDGILIGSPVYEMGITPQLSAFFSRFRAEYLVQKENPLARMCLPGAAIAVGGTRNGGQETTISIIHGFFHTWGMPIVNGGLGIYSGVSVWSQDRKDEGVAEDKVAMENLAFLGKKLALSANIFKSAKEAK